MLRTIQGTPVPAVGFGTWELVGDDTFPGVMAALELGYRHVDTAQVYENEAEVGRALADSGLDRDEIFLTTKVWNDRLTPDGIRESTRESLEKLRTDHVDLLLVHWPVRLDDLEANLAAFVELQEAGATSHIGVSNFTPAMLDRALEIAPLFALQVEHHAYLAQPRLLEMCARHDLLFTAYSPLARGQLLKDPAVVAIARERDATPAQVLLRWILDEDEHTAVIPKATARERIAENLAAADVELTPGDHDVLAALDRDLRTVDPDWAPTWSR
ncbi:MAG TPA: aldo/keto reductase [Acidimicrobiales bacterium]|nr:aldo/keto reductase [Acidimicrobiales bacterium]